ncbi:hypothetical protein N476_22020 [Pseudoalteromonas luteoviolacea H33]|uniref:Uncharacterized protein n=1 Tax=Pseudoalteromonas luteoviolacea H33 TaxID=1365251 RepID=A0A161XY96_9GAMM|nr:hypothetical protein N476_22020 [Pseudoalteromonas luteoviolacea H33]KZN70056.1 hypothetical protein N477_26025 [Pseudoalteromonas luteoviolacea H33-S]
MNGKEFEKGRLNWLLSSAGTASIFYMIFSVVFLYPSSDHENIATFTSDNIIQYSIYSVSMCFAFWGYWLYNESLYQKEIKSRKVGDKF